MSVDVSFFEKTFHRVCVLTTSCRNPKSTHRARSLACCQNMFNCHSIPNRTERNSSEPRAPNLIATRNSEKIISGPAENTLQGYQNSLFILQFKVSRFVNRQKSRTGVLRIGSLQLYSSFNSLRRRGIRNPTFRRHDERRM